MKFPNAQRTASATQNRSWTAIIPPGMWLFIKTTEQINQQFVLQPCRQQATTCWCSCKPKGSQVEMGTCKQARILPICLSMPCILVSIVIYTILVQLLYYFAQQSTGWWWWCWASDCAASVRQSLLTLLDHELIRRDTKILGTGLLATAELWTVTPWPCCCFCFWCIAPE